MEGKHKLYAILYKGKALKDFGIFSGSWNQFPVSAEGNCTHKNDVTS
jgi:hypothetical protein